MSEMDDAMSVSARAATPIVMVIGLRSQKYLVDNEVLKAIYGDNAPRRVALLSETERSSSIDWEMLYLYEGRTPEWKLKLLERFDVRASALDAFVLTEPFYRAVYEYLLEKTGLQAEDAAQVRVIVCSKDLLAEGLPMPEVARRFFPNTTGFYQEDEVARPVPFHASEQPVD